MVENRRIGRQILLKVESHNSLHLSFFCVATLAEINLKHRTCLVRRAVVLRRDITISYSGQAHGWSSFRTLPVTSAYLLGNRDSAHDRTTVLPADGLSAILTLGLFQGCPFERSR
jgi:hypothetical protein